MNAKLILIGLLLSLFFLSSCTLPLVSQGRLNRMELENYFIGTKGLEIKFLDQAPPSEVFETTDFDVQMYIANKGAFSLADNYSAKATLIYDKSKVEKITDPTMLYATSYIQNGLIFLFGKSYYTPDGEQNYFAIDRFKAKEVPTNFETAHLDFGLSVCYPYKTTFVDSICIDSDPQKIDPRNDACQVQDKTYSQGQGAPIAITAVDVQMIPRGIFVQPRFVIYVENKGNGIVYKYEDNMTQEFTINGRTTRTCGDMVGAKPNQLAIEAYLGEEKLDCSLPVLREAKTKIECQLSSSQISGNVANFMTTLRVNLKYFYSEVFSKEVVIKQADSNLLSRVKPLGPTYCAFYETYDPITQTCLTNCEYYALYNQSFLENSKDLHKPYGQDWEDLSCSYSNHKECRTSGGLCAINSSDLCMAGQYCGWPECIYHNVKPRIVETMALGRPTVSYTWTCNDVDDRYDIKKTCGCETTGYFKFIDSGSCRKLTVDDMETIQGHLGYNGIRFELDIPVNASTLCVGVRDKLGELVVKSAYI